MNLNMIKKVNTSDVEEIREITNAEFRKPIGPVTLSSSIYDISTQIVDGGNSLLAYWVVCNEVLTTFVRLVPNKAWSTVLELKDYINIIVETLNELKSSELFFSYMNDLKKWVKIITGEMSSEGKAQFYAFDKVISEQIDSEHFIPLSKYIGDEDHKTNVLFKTYYSFLKSKIKNQ